LQRAVSLAQQGHARGVELTALYWISHLYRISGSSDSALHYGGGLLRTARSYEDSIGAALGLFALAQVYAEIERSDSLSPSVMEALTLCQRRGGCWFENQLIALAAPLLLKTPEGMPLLRSIASNAEAHADTVGLCALYDAMGRLFTEYLQQYDSAVVYHRKVLQLKRAGRETAYGLGRAFRGLRMPDSSWFYFRALEIAARQVGDLRAEGYALGNLGGVCHRDVNPPLLECALAYYDSAASLASQVLRQAGHDMNRVAYGEQASQIYSEWPFAWLSLTEAIGKDAANSGALAVTELGRSEALRDLMGRFQTRQRLPVLGVDAAALGRQMVSMLPAGAATLSYLVQQDTLLAWLTLPTREVRVYRWAMPIDSLRAIVSTLRSSLGANDAVAGSRLRGTVSRTQRANAPDAMMLSIVAHRLTGLLIPNDLSELLPPGSDLVLVPHSVLNLVPFDILPIRGDTTLGEYYAIRYTPSLIALIRVETTEAAGSRSARNQQTALVVSDPTMPVADLGEGVRMRLAQLPGADSEGAWVAARLGVPRLSGSNASESEVRRRMGHADIIHFATHALAYAYYSKARDSFLALAPDSTHDGLLTVGELMDDSTLVIAARLIVLSGCQTALGPVMQSEGTVGLQRAFLAKGARALLVSLWSVDDEATKMLMQRFYEHWLGDRDTPTKAESLRRAQQDVRRTPRFEHPLYWAGFELVGAN
jgi:CHAT domain-containing protein